MYKCAVKSVVFYKFTYVRARAEVPTKTGQSPPCAQAKQKIQNPKRSSKVTIEREGPKREKELRIERERPRERERDRSIVVR